MVNIYQVGCPLEIITIFIMKPSYLQHDINYIIKYHMYWIQL